MLLGNVIPIWEDPLWLAETLATIDMISRGRLVSGWVRGTGPRERVAQLPGAVQLGAVPGGPRLRRQGVDDAGAVPLGGGALPVPLREPVDAALSAAPPADLGPGHPQQEHRRVVRQAPHPLHHAGHPAGADQAVVRLLRPGRPGRPATRPDRSTAATCSRCTSTRPRSWPTRRGAKFIEGPSNIFLEGSRATANPFIQNLPGPDLAHPAAPDHGGLPGAAVARPGHRAGLGPGRDRQAGRAGDRRPEEQRPAGSSSTRASWTTTPSSPARRRRSSPRSATSSRRCGRGTSSSGTATAP